MPTTAERQLIPSSDPEQGAAVAPQAPSGRQWLMSLVVVAGIFGIVSLGAVHSGTPPPFNAFSLNSWSTKGEADKVVMSATIDKTQLVANVKADKLKKRLQKQAIQHEMEHKGGVAQKPWCGDCGYLGPEETAPEAGLCGFLGGNMGALLSDRPQVVNSSCACAAICANTGGCAGWTYDPMAGMLTSTGRLAACFLRSTWSNMFVTDSMAPSATAGDTAKEAVEAGDYNQDGRGSCLGSCWSAPADNCGVPWNFAAEQYSTVPAYSACECAALCQAEPACDAYTYIYGDGPDNCWLMAEAFGGTVKGAAGCYDQCYSGQSMKAKCGTAQQGFYYLGATTMNSATDITTPCGCEQLCLKSDGCKAWTYEVLNSGSGLVSEVASNTCLLFSMVSAKKSCTNCISDTVKGAAKEFNELEMVNARIEKHLRKQEEKNSICGKTSSATGTMASIAGKNFAAVANFPQLDSCSYAAVSKYLTALPFVESSAAVTEDIRALYPRIVGTYVVQAYTDKLNSASQLSKAQNLSNCSGYWEGTIAQISEELEMLQVTEGWFQVFANGFDGMSTLVFDAFTTTAALIDMPATTEVAQNKVNWWKVSFDILSAVVKIGALVATDGASVAGAQALKGATAAGKDAKEADEAVTAAKAAYDTMGLICGNLEGMSDLCGDIMGAASGISAGSTGSGQTTDDSDSTTADYYVFTDSVIKDLGQILTIIIGMQSEIASNYGRMQAASTLAGGCPITNELMSKVVSGAYGAAQWHALGALLPSKYAIYWQRDYMGTWGPNCYYNNCGGGTSDEQCGSSSSAPLGCSGSSRGCWEPDIMKWDATITKQNYLFNPFTCAEEVSYSSGVEAFEFCAAWEAESGCIAKRQVWMAETSNPSQLPTDPFWEALTGPDGPITTYINRRYGTVYVGAEGGFAAFMSQCQYMPKVYIPVNGPSFAETQVSSVKVDCDVYGIKIPTYAFEDCGTQRSGTNVCINGYGINKDGTSGDATGNFNTFMWLPNTPGDYANHKSKQGNKNKGQVGCCLPWTSVGYSTPTLPAGCDFALCDCFSLAIAGNDGDLTESDGQSANSGDWWGSCTVDTNNAVEKNFVQSSLGKTCPWPAIPLLGNDFTICTESVDTVEGQALGGDVPM